jgi:dihydrofolate reductase
MALTLGHHLIMGRKTYDSIGKPLEGRTNIVVTRNTEYQLEGCLVADSVATALVLAEANGESEAFIGGGTGIYREALPATDRLYLSRIHAEFQVDTYFPEFDMLNWTQISERHHPADEKNPHPFTFYIYERKF